MFVLIFNTGSARIAQQFHDGRAIYAAYLGDWARRVAFGESGNHVGLLFGLQYVHGEPLCLSGQALSTTKTRSQKL
jgi:hypothetical protein